MLVGISAKLLSVSSGKNEFAINLTTTITRNPAKNKPRSAKKIEELPLDMKLSIEYLSLNPRG
jgi:hypothetical protein